MWRFLRNPNGQGAICNGILAVLAALDGAPCAAGVTAVMAWLDVAAYRRSRAGRR